MIVETELLKKLIVKLTQEKDELLAERNEARFLARRLEYLYQHKQPLDVEIRGTMNLWGLQDKAQ